MLFTIEVFHRLFNQVSDEPELDALLAGLVDDDLLHLVSLVEVKKVKDVEALSSVLQAETLIVVLYLFLPVLIAKAQFSHEVTQNLNLLMCALLALVHLMDLIHHVAVKGLELLLLKVHLQFIIIAQFL